VCGNDDYTVLLISSDTTDGSVVFTDTAVGGESPHAITPAGDAHHETDAAKFGASSLYFDGNLDCLSVADSADWDFPGDFTVDLWLNFSELYNYQQIINFGGDFTLEIEFGEPAGHLAFSAADEANEYWVANEVAAPKTDWATGTWYHIALTRSDGTFYFFIDGQLQVTYVYAGPLYGSGVNIGAWCPDERNFHGYIDEVRVSKGIARWVEAFVPPPVPYFDCRPTSTPTAMPSATFTPEPSPTSTPELCVHSGDVNDDGTVTPSDAQSAFMFYLNCIPLNPNSLQYCAADFCGSGYIDPCDGSVTPGDAQGIMRQYLGFAVPCTKRDTAAGGGAGGILTLEPAGMGQHGEWVVDVTVSANAVPVSAVGLELLYDPAQLAFVRAERGTADPGWFLFGAHEAKPGTVVIGAVSLNSLPSGSAGSLATLRFRVKSSDDTTMPAMALGTLADDLSDWEVHTLHK